MPNYLKPVILAIIIVAVYANSLGNNILWDDHLFLENWQELKTGQIKEILRGSAPPEQDKIYRPLRGLIYVLDYQLWRATPVFYHLQAVLIHILVTILVYLIVRQIFPKLAFWTALLFAVHPIHTETINYISASMETWGSLFFFLSFYFYLRQSAVKAGNQKFLFYLISSLFAFAAFFTYEMTLTLPILILLYEIILNKLKVIAKKLLPVLPYFLATGSYLFIRFFLLGVAGRGDYLAYSFYHTQLTMVKVFARYIGLLLWPINQTAIHNLVSDFPSSMLPYDKLDPILNQTIGDLDVLVAVALLIGLVLLSIKYIKTHPIITFSISWFLLSLLPVSFIIPFGGAMAEKYLYISSFGFILGVVYVISNLNKKSIMIAILILLAVFYSVLTMLRNPVWHDDISLFSDVVKKSPNNLLANYTLGVWLGNYNQPDRAAAYYKKAIEKAPEFWQARNNLANIYLKKGQYSEATQQYNYVLQLVPNYQPVKNILNNMDYLKEASPSSTMDVWISLTVKNGLSFKFPAYWSIKDLKNKVVLKDGENNLTVVLEVEDYLKQQIENLGTVIREGQAQIPNFEKAFVRFFEDKGIIKLQFFLFKDQSVVKVLAYPANASSMREFDGVLGSIQLP